MSAVDWTKKPCRAQEFFLACDGAGPSQQTSRRVSGIVGIGGLSSKLQRKILCVVDQREPGDMVPAVHGKFAVQLVELIVP
jgi:hypothetical protein